jgi:regulator of protease activity HflC (stomatin/prohibitin superfamily)
MKSIKIMFLLALTMSLVGCGFYTVPPASKGKILTTSGYMPEVLEPGKYTLWGRDDLITLDTSTKVYGEPVPIILSDKLTITVNVKFAGRIAGTPAVINTMFDDIVAGTDHKINFNEVYAVYGRMIVRNKTREIVSEYNVDEVHKNYKRISAQIAEVVSKAFVSTPLEISNIAIGNISYPAVVTDAIQANEERRLAIDKETAQAAIDIVKKKNALALAEADYGIQIKLAEAVRDKNKIIGQGITPALLQLRALEVQEKMAENKSAVFIPYEAMGSVGVQNRVFSSKQN